MDGKLYLIERVNESTDFRYYAEHGEVGGVPDAIGYDCSAHARKFRTEDEAQSFIQTNIPEWGRNLHRVVGLSFYIWDAPELAIMLRHGIEIPDDMLEPTANRLRIWER